MFANPRKAKLLLCLMFLLATISQGTAEQSDTFLYLPFVLKGFPHVHVYFEPFNRCVGYEAYILIVATPPDDIVRATAQIEDRRVDLSPTEWCYRKGPPCDPAWSGTLCLTGLEPGEKQVTAIAFDRFGNSFRACRTLTYTPDNFPPPCFPIELVGHYEGEVQAIFVQGNYAYLGEGSNLTILDISTPTSPIIVGQIAPLAEYVWAVYVSGNYAYTAVGYTVGYDDLRVVDVSEPTNPTEVGSYDAPGNGRDVYVSDNIAYLANGTGGLRVIDVSEPSSPAELDSFEMGQWFPAMSVYVSGRMAYLVIHDVCAGEFTPDRPWTHLWTVDISNPADLIEVATHEISNFVNDIYVTNNTGYLVHSTVGPDPAGLLILDMTNPPSLTELGFYDVMRGDAEAVYVSGGLAYVADGSEGLRVLNVSDPTNPIKLGFYDTPGYAQDVYVSNGLAYVADGPGGLFILRYKPAH